MGSPETASIIVASIGGLALVTISLMAVAVRAGRLLEAVSRLERDSRDRWAEWSRTWRDRTAATDRRLASIDHRIDRYGGVGDDD